MNRRRPSNGSAGGPPATVPVMADSATNPPASTVGCRAPARVWNATGGTSFRRPFAPLLLAFALTTAVGCGEKKDPSQRVPLPLTPEAQRILDEAEKSPEASLALLNETLKDWLLRHPDYPKTVQEFVTARVLPKLPTPPPGKEFAIDRTGGMVVLVDK